MWNVTRARLFEAERADWNEADQSPPLMSISSKASTSQKEVGEPRAGRRSGKRTRRSTKKGGAPTKAGKEKLGVALAPLGDAVAQGLSFVDTSPGQVRGFVWVG